MDRRQPEASMSLERITELAERCGGQLAHWPCEEASAARKLLAKSAEARAVLARANRLDDILGQARTRSVATHLRQRILAAAPERGWRELVRCLWPFGPVWRPAAALLGLALAGIFLGSTDAATLVSPVSVNGALSEEIQVVAFSAVEVLDEGAQWLR